MARDYIHGYGSAEEARLVDQARVLAPAVYGGLHLPASGRLLELGCGVGAELEHLARRRPGLELTGIDLSASHLAAAARRLGRSAGLVRADARALPFPDHAFDAVLTIWMLEHVPGPEAVLAEGLRVLRPEGELICTEVDNATFRCDGLPAVAAWWERFSRWQAAAGGDPWVGQRLVSLARALGCREVSLETVPVVSTTREPGRRAELADYLRDLLLSGADALLGDGWADAGLRDAVRRELARARRDPSIPLEYRAMRLRCRPPAPPRGLRRAAPAAEARP